MKKLFKRICVFAVIISLIFVNISSSFVSKVNTPNNCIELIKQSLHLANSNKLLVKNDKGIESIDIDQVVSAIYDNSNRVSILYRDSNLLSKATYLEPNRPRYLATSLKSLTPNQARKLISGNVSNQPILTAYDAGRKLGLNTLKSLVENKTSNIIVAVLDTGADIDHSWLKDRIVSPYNTINHSKNADDTEGHGTHVAGIIASNTPNNVKIMPIKIFDEGSTFDSYIVEGIYYAVNNGAKIINMSLGGNGTSSYLDKAIDYAISNGVAIVVASGNEADDISYKYPAAFPEVITVGATGRNGDFLYFSNTGKNVDICAPGEKITSSVLDDKTESYSGTSMAAPFVSAAASMLLLENEKLSPVELEGIIKSNVRDVGAPGKDDMFGYGEIAFKNYKSNTDFYQITSDNENPEAKYSLTINYFTGSNISKVDFVVDGTSLYTTNISVPGEGLTTLDIRNLSMSNHELVANALDSNGNIIASFTRKFLIPEYNVRVKLMDINNYNVGNIIPSVLGYSDKGKTIKKLDIISSTESNGMWLANIDFEKAYKSCEIIRLYISFISNNFYIRGIAEPGEKVFDTSESVLFIIENIDNDAITSPVANLQFYANSISGLNVGKQADIYMANAVSLIFDFKDIQLETGTANVAYTYIDKCNLWLSVYSTSKEIKAGETSLPDTYYYNGLTGDLPPYYPLSMYDLGKFKIKTDIKSDDNVDYSIKDLNSLYEMFYDANKKENINYFTPGYYEVRTYSSRKINKTITVRDNFTNRLFIDAHYTNYFTIGEYLLDRYSIWDNGTSILQTFEDNNGNAYQFSVQDGIKASKNVNPQLILTNLANAKQYKLSSQFISTSNNLYILNIPDGTYNMQFKIDSTYLALPLKKSFSQVTIKNGKASISNNNTSPIYFGEDTIYMAPNTTCLINLYDDFYDKEQDNMTFSPSTGNIVNGMFMYTDYSGLDKNVTITASDGAGGQITITKRIVISGKNYPDSDYIPIADIDSIGASESLLPYIKKAIKNNIIPTDLLSDYQALLTKKQMANIIVSMLETKYGEVSPAVPVNSTTLNSSTLLKAFSLGIIPTNNIFYDYKGYVTNQEMCRSLYNSVGVLKPGASLAIKKPGIYSDGNLINADNKNAIDFCVEKGIITASGNKVNPNEKITREQAIKMVNSVYELYK